MFVPKDIKPGEQRPAMVFVHGGPVRQMLLGYHYRHFYHMAYAVNQWLVSQGYIVHVGELPQRRRLRAIVPRRRRAPAARATRSTATCSRRASICRRGRTSTPKRVGIWGLSYGGVLTAQALARNSDLFAAGMDLAGVHLWGNSLEPERRCRISRQRFARSTRWKSPVLLIHGDDDRNVAFQQTTGLVQLLRARNVDYELIVFPDDVHDSLLHSRWIYTFERMDEFLKKFVIGN